MTASPYRHRILPSLWRSRYAVEVALLILLWTTYAYFYQSTGTNEAVRFDQIRALVQDHTLAIDTYCYNSPDLIRYPDPGGKLYPNKAPGLTLLGVAPWAVLSSIFAPLRAVGLPEWVYWHLLTYFTTVLSVSLVSALGAIAIYRVLQKLTKDSYFSGIVVLSIWLGTLLFPYSTLFYSHAVAASLLAIAFYLLFKLRSGDSGAANSHAIYTGVAGALIGWSVATEYPAILLGAALGIYALWIIWRLQTSRRSKMILSGALALGVTIGGATLLLYNLIAFGKVFYIPYQAYATPGTAFHSSYAHGWMGLHWTGLTQFLHALASVTCYRPGGLLYIVIGAWHVYACNPVLWLTLPGLAVMIWNRQLRPEGLLVVAMLVVYLLFICNYGSSMYDWGGGLFFGPRHLIPVLPFLAIPLYFGAQKVRWLFYPLAAISLFYMLLATAVEPRIAFPFGDIARDFLLPDYLTGQFGQNTASLFDFAHRNLTDNSTAANPAKLAHVPGRYQLVPLMAWWLAGGVTLLFLLKRKWESVWRKPPAIGLVLFLGAIAFAPAIHHAVAVPHSDVHGLLAKYYRNASWNETPVDIEIDPTVDFDWSKATPYPPPFSVEWTGDVIVEREGYYLLTVGANGAATLEVDGKLLVDATHAPMQEKGETVFLTNGFHSIRMRYSNTLVGGSVRLWWTLVGRPRQIVPNEALVPQMTRQPR